jgi:hypothetical protein
MSHAGTGCEVVAQVPTDARNTSHVRLTHDGLLERARIVFSSPCSAPALGEQAHANIHVYSACTHAPCAWGRSDPSDCLNQRRGNSKGRGVGHPFSVSDKWCRDGLPLRALLSRHRLAVRGGDYRHLGSRLIAAGGQSQVEGLERHRPLTALLLLLGGRPSLLRWDG